MARLSRIRKIFQTKRHPFKKLLAWANNPRGPHGKESRFRSLRKWAQKQRQRHGGQVRDAWSKRGRKYRRKTRYFAKKADAKAEKQALEPGPVSIFDGKPVASEWVPILSACRRSGLWAGSLVSGYRTPEYSESLCYRICGAPSCSGTCAGRSSNHSKTSVAAGSAVDVSDPIGFRRALIHVGHSELHNALGARDPVHFSITGR